MVYLKRSEDGQYFADALDEHNKKVLMHTEMHTQKHNCWKNIFAIAFAFNGGKFEVVDWSSGKNKVYFCQDGTKTLYKPAMKL